MTDQHNRGRAVAVREGVESPPTDVDHAFGATVARFLTLRLGEIFFRLFKTGFGLFKLAT